MGAIIRVLFENFYSFFVAKIYKNTAMLQKYIKKNYTFRFAKTTHFVLPVISTIATVVGIILHISFKLILKREYKN